MKSGGAILAIGLLFILLVVGLVFFAMRQRRVVPVAQAKPGVYGLVGQGIGAIIGNWGSWSSGTKMGTSVGNDSIGSGSWDWYDNIGKPDSGANLGNWSDKLSIGEFGSFYGGAGKADQWGYTGPAAGAPNPMGAIAEATIPDADAFQLKGSKWFGGGE